MPIIHFMPRIARLVPCLICTRTVVDVWRLQGNGGAFFINGSVKVRLAQLGNRKLTVSL